MRRVGAIALTVVAGLGWGSVALSQDSAPPVINDLVGPDGVADCEAAGWAAMDTPEGEMLPPEARRVLYSCLGEVQRGLDDVHVCQLSTIKTEGIELTFNAAEVCVERTACPCLILSLDVCFREDGRCLQVGPRGDVAR